MTKDVLITIRGVHTMDEEDNDVEMIVRGDYYQKNGKHYVLYEELLEGFKEPVKNIIKITPTSMDITKKGTATQVGWLFPVFFQRKDFRPHSKLLLYSISVFRSMCNKNNLHFQTEHLFLYMSLCLSVLC